MSLFMATDAPEGLTRSEIVAELLGAGFDVLLELGAINRGLDKALVVWLRRPEVVEALAEVSGGRLQLEVDGLADAWLAGSLERPRRLTSDELHQATLLVRMFAVTGCFRSTSRIGCGDRLVLTKVAEALTKADFDEVDLRDELEGGGLGDEILRRRR